MFVACWPDCPLPSIKGCRSSHEVAELLRYFETYLVFHHIVSGAGCCEGDGKGCRSEENLPLELAIHSKRECCCFTGRGGSRGRVVVVWRGKCGIVKERGRRRREKVVVEGRQACFYEESSETADGSKLSVLAKDVAQELCVLDLGFSFLN